MEWSKYPSKQPAYIRAKYHARKAAGICRCCKNPRKEGVAVCEAHHQRELERSRHYRAKMGKEWWVNRNIMLKTKVMTGYGGKCVCCGETRLPFLSVDHIGGGGDKHRLEVGSGPALYAWIIKNDFPKTLRCLCMNCNMATKGQKKCPHEIEREAVLS